MPEPDGHGIYLRVSKKFEDPDLDNWVRATPFRTVGKDANGAGMFPTPFSFGPNVKRILLGIRVTLCEMDDGIMLGCSSHEYFDNPRTLDP